MNKSFYQEHKIFQKSVKKFCDKEITPYLTDWEEKKFFPNQVFEKLGNEGFLSILISDELGGVGGDYKMAAAWCEAFGEVPSLGLTTAVNMHSLVISPAVAENATEEQKQKWIPEAVLGKKIGAYAFTEPGAGSDLSSIRTKAKKDGDHYILNGAKTFITNGKRADFIIVLTKTDDKTGYSGFTSFVVDTKSDGFEVSKTLDKYGWHCSDTAELSFENVKVHKDCILRGEGQGWKLSMESLGWERVMLSLNSLAGAKKCLEQTLKYCSDRKVFGQKVSEFENNKRKFLIYSSRLLAAQEFARNCIERLCQDRSSIILESALLKSHLCELAIEIADFCLQMHGGYGYTTEFLPEMWLRELRLNTIGGGTTEIMNQIAIKQCYKSIKKG